MKIRGWQKQGGWEVDEAEGVSPVYCGRNAREDALSYARQRAGSTPTEICVLDAEWNVVEAISQPVRGLGLMRKEPANRNALVREFAATKQVVSMRARCWLNILRLPTVRQ